MERITSDIQLRGNIWNDLLNFIQPSIFKTQYGAFALCIAIGIMYDKQTSFDEEDNSEPRYIPRTMLYQNKAELEILFQTAILTSETIQFTEDQRLELAFGSTKHADFNEMQFLTKFANYGATVLFEKISEDPIESMENIKSFITSTVEGTNFDIDPLSEDDLEITEEDL